MRVDKKKGRQIITYIFQKVFCTGFAYLQLWKKNPLWNLRFLDASVVDEGTQPKDDVEAKEDKPGDLNDLESNKNLDQIKT